MAGLPLLTIYSVPISLLDGGVSLWVFVPTAVGFMTLLFLHENDMINRWGRPIGADRERAGSIGSFGVRTGAARSSATAIGSVATGLAIVVPLLIPTLDINVFDFGAGSGGDSNVKIENPTADLLRDLNRGRDIPLIRVTTDDPDPGYLRVTSLNRFSNNEWSPGNRDIPSDHRPDGRDAATPRGVRTDRRDAVRLPDLDQRQLRVGVAADAVPDLEDRCAGRLALRRTHHGLLPLG